MKNILRNGIIGIKKQGGTALAALALIGTLQSCSDVIDSVSKKQGKELYSALEDKFQRNVFEDFNTGEIIQQDEIGRGGGSSGNWGSIVKIGDMYQINIEEQGIEENRQDLGLFESGTPRENNVTADIILSKDGIARGHIDGPFDNIILNVPEQAPIPKEAGLLDY